MCGIVGILSKYTTLPYFADSLFQNMLAFDSIRGPDSTGVFGVTKTGHVDYMKGDCDGYVFTRSKNWLEFKSRMKDYYLVVGHNRKATSGSVTATNAHPFQEKHIILVHNGTLRSDKGLENTEVDSQAIAKALAQHDAPAALKLLDGAYALVWFDQEQKTLNLARNSERPLSLVEYDSTWVISSEVGLPLWLQARENRKIVTNGITQVPEKKILVFKLNRLQDKPIEIAYEEYSRWSPPKHTPSPTHTVWPKSTVDTPAILRSPVDHRVISLPKQKSVHADKLTAGSRISFTLEDSKEDGSAHSEVLFGHPVFEGEKDTNILVRYVVPKGQPWTDFFGPKMETKCWRGTIIHYRDILHVPTVFVKNIEPLDEIKDAQGEANDKSEVEKAIEQGCTRCKEAVSIAEVEQAIVRKKSDGSWRIVCPKCLNTSIEEAKKANPSIQIGSSTIAH